MAKIQGLDMRKGTILRVVKIGSEKAFELKSLRIDQFGPYNALTDPRKRKQDFEAIKIFRGNKLFDEGTIAEYGTHGRGHVFWGLEKAVVSARRAFVGSSVIIGNLQAKWFRVGDLLALPSLPSDFYKWMLDNWRQQLRVSRTYVAMYKRAHEKLSQLQAERRKRGLSLVMGDSLRMCLWARDHNQAFAQINALISAVPIPEIITWKNV